MAHQEHRTLVIVNRVLDRLDALHVEVVGRLVENEQVGPLQRDQGEGQPGALPAGKGAGEAHDLVAGEPEGAEVILDGAPRPERALFADRIVQRQVQRQLCHVLPEIGRLHRAAHLRLAAVRGALAEQCPEEGRLAGPVRADEGDHIAPVHGGRELLHQGALTLANRQPVGPHDAVAATFGDLEAERHRAALSRRRREARQPVELLAAPLGLGRVLAGEIAADVVLFPGDHLPLLLHLPIERQAALQALLDERRVAAAIRVGRAALDMQQVVDDDVQKGAVVADDDDRLTGIQQPLLQPVGRLEVEMVRGFVEQDQIRRRRKLRREADTPALASAQ